MGHFSFPDGKQFAFTIVDDTDVSTVANTRPFYDLLFELDMRVTKTVWPVDCPEGSRNYSSSETLADLEHLEFARDLQQKGFEISWHSATMESSKRERIEKALEVFNSVFGHYPRVHANHSYNREGIYWGHARYDDPFVKFLSRKMLGLDNDFFQGETEGSPYYWGDLCSRHIKYARNLTYNCLDVSSVNPTLPYRDPNRTLVPYWFSSTDIDNASDFIERFQGSRLDQLEKNGGVCIVATHIGKGYVENSEVLPEIREILTDMAARNGWFPTVSTLLDHLLAQQENSEIGRQEWRSMQWRWLFDLVARKFSGLWGRLS